MGRRIQSDAATHVIVEVEADEKVEELQNVGERCCDVVKMHY